MIIIYFKLSPTTTPGFRHLGNRFINQKATGKLEAADVSTNLVSLNQPTVSIYNR